MKMLLRLSLRSLARNRRRSAFTLIAIGVGVAVVVFAHGFGEGLLRSLILQTVSNRTGAIQVHKVGYLDATEAAPLKLDMEDTPALRSKIAGVAGVKAVAPRIRFGGILGTGAVSSMVLGEALDPTAELLVCPDRPAELQPGMGTYLTAEKPRAGVVGSELAKSLKTALGETLTLTASGREGQMNALDLEVGGITRGAALLESKRVVAVPLAYAQDLLQMNGRVTEYAIAVHDLDQVPAVVDRLRAALGPEYEVSTWGDILPFLRDTVFRLRVVLNGISVVLFAIVVLGVINTMLMSVFERVREIGTMLAIGWRRRRILMLFLMEALALGLTGGVAGAVLGYALTMLAAARGIVVTAPGSSFEQFIRPVPSLEIAIIAVVAAALGAVLAALYPARKASLMNPVDALRTI